MPELREVFEMTTKQMGEPDVDSWGEQQKRQRNANLNRKLGALALTAAILVAAVVVMTVLVRRAGVDPAERVPAARPSTPPTTAPEATAPVGTVTFRGSTCSIKITADRIEPGVVRLEVVNATDRRATFDSWQLQDGYTFPAFETAIERVRRTGEGAFPGWKSVTFRSSDVIAANTSETLDMTWSTGRHAIVCLKPDGAPRLGLQNRTSRFRPWGVIGPIVVR